VTGALSWPGRHKKETTPIHYETNNRSVAGITSFPLRQCAGRDRNVRPRLLLAILPLPKYATLAMRTLRHGGVGLPQGAPHTGPATQQQPRCSPRALPHFPLPRCTGRAGNVRPRLLPAIAPWTNQTPNKSLRNERAVARKQQKTSATTFAMHRRAQTARAHQERATSAHTDSARIPTARHVGTRLNPADAIRTPLSQWPGSANPLRP